MNWISTWVATPCPYKEPEHCEAVAYKVPPSFIYQAFVFAFCHLSTNSLDYDTKWVLFLEPASLTGLSSGGVLVQNSANQVTAPLQSRRQNWSHKHLVDMDNKVTLLLVSVTRLHVKQYTQFFVLIAVEEDSKAATCTSSP